MGWGTEVPSLAHKTWPKSFVLLLKLCNMYIMFGSSWSINNTITWSSVECLTKMKQVCRAIFMAQLILIHRVLDISVDSNEATLRISMTNLKTSLEMVWGQLLVHGLAGLKNWSNSLNYDISFIHLQQWIDYWLKPTCWICNCNNCIVASCTKYCWYRQFNQSIIHSGKM